MATKKAPQGPDPQAWEDLTSHVHGLYDEMDKLAKKNPSAALSELATKHVNRAIRDAKAMMAAHDTYMADLAEFVAAGDNPEVRDTVLVLREIEQGLSRLNAQFGLHKARHGY